MKRIGVAVSASSADGLVLLGTKTCTGPVMTKFVNYIYITTVMEICVSSPLALYLEWQGSVGEEKKKKKKKTARPILLMRLESVS